MLMSHKILYSNHKADFYQDTASLDFQEYGKINPTGTMIRIVYQVYISIYVTIGLYTMG